MNAIDVLASVRLSFRHYSFESTWVECSCRRSSFSVVRFIWSSTRLIVLNLNQNWFNRSRPSNSNCYTRNPLYSNCQLIEHNFGRCCNWKNRYLERLDSTHRAILHPGSLWLSLYKWASECQKHSRATLPDEAEYMQLTSKHLLLWRIDGPLTLKLHVSILTWMEDLIT